MVLVVQRGDERADVQDPEDVVERLPVHRVARVRRVEHEPQRLLRGHLDRQTDDVGPRHHHVGRLLLGEVEDLVEHLLLDRLDLADVLGRRDRDAGCPHA